MAKKRFTDTEKWRDPWFMELPPLAKLLWIYLCDCCDNAGVWAVSKRRVEFEIGTACDLDAALVLFAGRVEVLDGGRKWHLTRFVAFQCGPVLHPKSPPHSFILRLLAHHGLPSPKGRGWVAGGVGTTPKETDTDTDTEKDREAEGEKDAHPDPTDLFSAPATLAAIERAMYPAPEREHTVGDLIAVGAIVRAEDRDGWEAALKRHGFPAMEKAIVALRARGAKPWVDAVVSEIAGAPGTSTPRTTKRVIDGVEYTIHDRK